MTLKRITVQVKLEPYLKAFILSIYSNDQQEPVFFPKQDKFNELLALLIDKPPKDYKPQPTDPKKLQIILPYFEHRNILTYNYLSNNSQQMIEKRIKDRFWVTYEDFMDQCFKKGFEITDSIILFIEKYRLPYSPSLEEKLRKSIYRSRLIQKKYPRRSYNKSSKKLVS